jgi:hypothetical protein
MISRQIGATLSVINGRVDRLEPVDHLGLALGPEGDRALALLDLAHCLRERGAAIQRGEQVAIDLVDLLAQGEQLGLGASASAMACGEVVQVGDESSTPSTGIAL